MCMKTDITEKDGNYLLDMELPGCRKEDIHLELNDGYLNISAARNSTQEEKRQQRKYHSSGTLQWQFLT